MTKTPSPAPAYAWRADYPASEAELSAEREKARADERLFGLGTTVNGWHVPAHLVSIYRLAQAAPAHELTDEEIVKVLGTLSPPGKAWRGPREHNIAFARAVIAADRSAHKSPAVGAAPDDLVQLVGVKDGVETVLGTATMPPKMKARELVRQYFGPFDHEADGGETDAGMAYVICEELIDWMAKTPQVFNVTAKPPVQETGEQP